MYYINIIKMHCSAKCGLLLPMFHGLCASVCPLLTTKSSAKTAKSTEMLFGLQTRVHPRNHVLGTDLDCPRGRSNFGEHFPAHCEWGISGVGQSYLLGGSSDAVVHCQYCSNLLFMATQSSITTRSRQLLKQARQTRTHAQMYTLMYVCMYVLMHAQADGQPQNITLPSLSIAWAHTHTHNRLMAVCPRLPS